LRTAGGALSTATVTVKVSGVNDAPLAHDDQASTDEDNVVLVQAVANDTDADTKDILRVSKVEGVTQGAIVTLREDGRLAYIPAARSTASAPARRRRTASVTRSTMATGGHPRRV
jgi:Bacterial cadherin-like domain